MKYSFKCPECGQDMKANAKNEKEAETKIESEMKSHNKEWHSEKAQSAEKLKDSIRRNMKKS